MAGVALQRMVLICASLSMVTVCETPFRKQMIRNLPEVSGSCRTGTRVCHASFAAQQAGSFMRHLKAIRRFLTTDHATTAVEYAVMLAMILVAIIVGVTYARGGVRAGWDNLRPNILNYGS